jgi:molybdopterin-guanine dinucleotide biosynthesis protein A
VGGRRMLDRVADALRAVTDRLVVVSNAPNARRWLDGVDVIGDVRTERGSLVGLHTALSHANAPVLVVAWDMPFVESDLLRLIATRGRDARFAAIPEGNHGLEPFCAMYAPACLPIVASSIDSGDLRLSRFLEALPGTERISRRDVEAVADPVRCFFNVNTREDLARAEELAAKR